MKRLNNNYRDKVNKFLNFVFDNKEKEELDDGGNDDDMTREDNYMDVNFLSNVNTLVMLANASNMLTTTTTANDECGYNSSDGGGYIPGQYIYNDAKCFVSLDVVLEVLVHVLACQNL
ncbi:hypothetical protein Glove_309g163 [Diversispora epigaea]|uniref:Uncharacterized protein n=1 Tax=Diversispora epigaea TaxID=1348612 RepID=A0A397HXW8_9GLOM|nr:hypothetical protein Glove_309g163 [Diversispora epigaea]